MSWGWTSVSTITRLPPTIGLRAWRIAEPNHFELSKIIGKVFHRGLSSRPLGFLPGAVLLPLSARSPRSEFCGNIGDVSPLLGREPIEVEVLLRHQRVKGEGGGHIEVITDSVITKFENRILYRPVIDVARFCSGGGELSC